MYGYGYAIPLGVAGGGVSLPVNTVAPAITGTAEVGQTLTCSQGTWTGSPTSYTYQWKRGGVNIGGATNSTYVLVAADEGTSVKCTVTATNGAGSASADSNTVNVIGYLVEMYSPTVAYSLRKISSSATLAIRVRRESDNAEQDFGFVNSQLDNSSIATFCSGTNGFVVKWYNQGTGGSTYDATATAGSQQPIIYKLGSVFSVNSKPALDFERSGVAAFCAPMNVTSLSPLTTFAVSKVDTQVLVNYLIGNESPAQGLYTNGTFLAAGSFGGTDSTGNSRYNTSGNTSQHLGYWNNKYGKLYVSRNGSTESDLGSYSGNTINLIGGRTASNLIYLRGSLQELIMFTSDQTANKSSIETDINSNYAIY